MEGEGNLNWDGGVSHYPKPGLLIKNRKIILKQFPICQVCKSKKSEEAHHKDLSRDNHSIENLLAVCKKCHNDFKYQKRNLNYDKLNGLSARKIASNIQRSETYVRNRVYNNEINKLNVKRETY